MKINISPKSFTTKATSISIFNSRYYMNEKAEFIVQYYKEDGSPLEMQVISIEGEEFSAWGSDDNYIVDLVLSKLGLEKA